MSAGAGSRAWAMLLDLAPGMRVLEVSGDDGPRAEALAATGVEVIRVRPGQTPPDGPADAAVIAVEPLAGSDAARAQLKSLLTLVHPALQERGALVMSLPNPVFRWPGIATLAARASAGSPTAVLPGWPLPGPAWRPPAASGLRAMLAEAGFDGTQVFAALPDPSSPRFLVPVDDAAIIDYFFTNLLPRPHSVSRRAILTVVRHLGQRGLFPYLAPGFEVTAHKASPA